LRCCNAPIDDLLAQIGQENFESLLADWPVWARSDQLPQTEFDPSPDWKTWLVLGGRGAGKTRTGAEWIRYQALGKPPLASQPVARIALVGRTLGEVRDVMVEGVSGLLSVHGDDDRPTFLTSKNRLVWPNGAIAQLFSADEPDSLRGPQFDVAWCDELTKWRHMDATWDMLQFALRLGPVPRAVVTTTPKPVPLLKRLLADKATLLTRASTHDNAGFLSKSFLTEIERQYGGTRLGRQEIAGELIEDNPDALFQRDRIEKARVKTTPPLTRIVVGVDPPVTSKKSANACGIICAGLGQDNRAYVLDDMTLQSARPLKWAAKAVALYHARQADRLVVEVNQGGEMATTIIAEIDPAVPVKPVHAMRGKQLRAEPVAALYEQNRVSHVGTFPALEDEMCTFEQRTSARRTSPDRVDALVWALSELMLSGRPANPRISVL
jgi:phage terminase large subunit-like protein